VPSTPPLGEPAPVDGALPEASLAEVGAHPFGVYVHVPYCAHRCGYCDFNTYVDTEGAAARYVDATLQELRLAAAVLGDQRRPVDTVFVGGGTPTLLPAADLARLLRGIDDVLGVAPGAEVTTEANPETVDARYLGTLRAAGFTRLSVGMQSAVPHVLDTLERRHTVGRPERVISEAREAGFERASLDLIYGTPGETPADWASSVEAALSADPGHVSAYALVVEPGTALAARVERGELAVPDDDDAADRYEAADELLRAAGYDWYEVSNWSRPGEECRHNLHYWRSHDWWGVGPGAHSHVGGTRWWNVRLPRDYTAALAAGQSPAQAREVLDAETRRVERVLLGVRLAAGHPASDLTAEGRSAAERFVADGLLDTAAWHAGTVRLTERARLLADGIIRDLVE
jgi:oxygen-independent coproporphyrinogen-3 oxidase